MPSRPEARLSDFRSAADTVRLVLLAALPPSVPPSFREIASAHFAGSGRKRRAVGHLVMWDGRPATAEVFMSGKMGSYPVWGHRWTDMPGGACSWEGDRWVRCDEDGNVLPEQTAFQREPIDEFLPTRDRRI